MLVGSGGGTVCGVVVIVVFGTRTWVVGGGRGDGRAGGGTRPVCGVWGRLGGRNLRPATLVTGGPPPVSRGVVAVDKGLKAGVTGPGQAGRGQLLAVVDGAAIVLCADMNLGAAFCCSGAAEDGVGVFVFCCLGAVSGAAVVFACDVCAPVTVGSATSTAVASSAEILVSLANPWPSAVS